MKEVKKTAPAKKSNITKKSNAPKKPIPQKNNVNNKVDVVKETKVVNLDEKNDNKLIIIIGISILVIIGTVIGLLVGCEKKEEEEPTKPKDDINTPIKVEDDEKEEKEIVVKKTTVSTDTIKYKVKYYYKDEEEGSFSLYTTKVKFGKKLSKFVPAGYESCSYFIDKDLEKEVNFKQAVKSNKTIYMVCKLMRHTVKYNNYDGTQIKEELLVGTDNNNYIVLDGKEASCPEESKFLGWSKNATNKISYKTNRTTNVRSDLVLTAVCGKASVTYTNNIEATEAPINQNTGVEEEIVNTIAIGYDDLSNYDITGLDPVDDIGLTKPTYFVLTDKTPVVGNRVKTIIDDETEIVGDTEIKLSDVKNRPDWYTPEVADIVEEKDYEFDGWTKKDDDGEDVKITTPSEFAPDPDDESKNEVEANWVLQDGDEVDPNDSI